MDQATQVNFPVVVLRKNAEKKYKKANSMDLTMRTNRSLQTLQNPWLQLRPPIQRPKSLNLSTEMYHRSRISFMSETIPQRSYPPSDISISLPISRERTPPPSYQGGRSSRSSQLPRRLQSQQDLYSPGSVHSVASNCKCFHTCDRGSKGAKTADELSWRRLHMSRAKLKATSTTSELLSGFAMVAMVELQINEPTNVPEWLFIMFAVCTTILVSVHIFALMISTYILPNIDAISKLDVCELVSESPHERMRGYIELAWAFSTVLGLFLFLVEVAILCWVKFWDYSLNAAIAATVVVIPVLIIFILFAVHFYHSLVVHRCDTSETDMERLEELKRNLDEADKV